MTIFESTKIASTFHDNVKYTIANSCIIPTNCNRVQKLTIDRLNIISLQECVLQTGPYKYTHIQITNMPMTPLHLRPMAPYEFLPIPEKIDGVWQWKNNRISQSGTMSKHIELFKTIRKLLIMMNGLRISHMRYQSMLPNSKRYDTDYRMDIGVNRRVAIAQIKENVCSRVNPSCLSSCPRNNNLYLLLSPILYKTSYIYPTYYVIISLLH